MITYTLLHSDKYKVIIGFTSPFETLVVLIILHQIVLVTLYNYFKHLYKYKNIAQNIMDKSNVTQFTEQNMQFLII